ncbi:class I SAM-dependent DNA methyltransferase [Nocardia thailandica]
MPGPHTSDGVADAYDDIADLYLEMLDGRLTVGADERRAVEEFGELVRAAGNDVVADLGCGPGRIGEFLRRAGNRVTGVDASAEMIRHARERHPELDVRHGTIEGFLAAPPTPIGHALLWFSTIHMDPAGIGDLLRTVRDAVRPGGYVLIGFQTTDALDGDPVPYDHRVAAAHRFPLGWMRRVVDGAGLTTLGMQHRAPGPDDRVPSGYVLARRDPA